ncbi:MAG: SurA N-terminal domain-containing protein [Anaerolineales bacterium]|nr:SurA N-terminal domain-containing protein [Anaerolineales bacterium]
MQGWGKTHIAGIIGAVIMYNNLRWTSRICLLVTVFGLVLTACGKPSPQNEPTHTASPVIAPTITTLPTKTTEPLAAVVNGEKITQMQYEAELNRYQIAIGTELATEDKQRVLDDLINQILLAQGAAESGFTVDNALVQERFNQLLDDLGDRKAFDEWMNANGYHEADFKEDLKRSIAAAWMRDHITDQVPKEMEQIHARQILLYNSENANQAMEQLNLGNDFIELAAQYDPITNGDLGWFPRGYLLDEKLEEVVFNLQPGEYSDIIQTAAGYHIVQVIERDGQHPLDDAIRLDLQEKALDDWLADRRANSQIQIITS